MNFPVLQGREGCEGKKRYDTENYSSIVQPYRLIGRQGKLYAVHVYKHTSNGKPDKYTEEL